MCRSLTFARWVRVLEEQVRNGPTTPLIAAVALQVVSALRVKLEKSAIEKYSLSVVLLLEDTQRDKQILPAKLLKLLPELTTHLQTRMLQQP